VAQDRPQHVSKYYEANVTFDVFFISIVMKKFYYDDKIYISVKYISLIVKIK